MSLKENMQMVKDELNTEEKFFENAVKAERFVKKFKKPLIGTVAAVVIFVAANTVYTSMQDENIAASNSALALLQQQPTDATAKVTLQSLNPELYDVWSLTVAVEKHDTAALQALQNSTLNVVSDIAAYELAVAKSDNKLLSAYAKREDAIYKDLARIQLAVLQMEAGKTKEAHAELAAISPESPLHKVSRLLMHYGVK